MVITSKSKNKTSFVTTDMKVTVEYFQIQLYCLTCRNRKLEFLTFQFPRSLLLSSSPYCLPYHSYDICLGELGIASTTYPPNLFICFYVCFRVILTGEKIVITLSGEMVNIVIVNSVSITHER